MKKKGGSSGGKSKSIEADEFQYVEKLGKEELLAGVGKYALLGPVRQDLLYCMHEKSTVDLPLYKQPESNRN
ncbi:hypothetical protein G6F46_003735 [Rhizopus delemar]|uniref:Uncharacterized protein n=3 Tax=Rhizopus TaxID=4842 RepID=I1CIC1_RHIO9|nr:hypothetical protein RO3G_12912 [Rhizopus delemar RA 99-880]KAG1047742.1 hypothetical protein G6F43_009826 [Rhizopus delemar]KAG1136580.1 hypothetical protein G6F36_016153 [Rhizopus arrhizus]KAG1463238.1 hypothetical protein G6F55_002511 [Rhizopus delemar]KAG1501235.1 hypothetical protein G6F54_003180 [Rhizopus delemar]|eukprot:EIE88201.1 hypothetical protein RO3G_12912 [Rhizopus delemar RA 99-880]